MVDSSCCFLLSMNEDNVNEESVVFMIFDIFFLHQSHEKITDFYKKKKSGTLAVCIISQKYRQWNGGFLFWLPGRYGFFDGKKEGSTCIEIVFLKCS
jgi:hypothetical protein